MTAFALPNRLRHKRQGREGYWHRRLRHINRLTSRMNRLNLRLFATLRERTHTAELDRGSFEGTSIEEVWKALKRELPALDGHRDSVRFAVNREYVEGSYRPHDNDEITFIPPVSGGAPERGEPSPWVGSISIVRCPIDVAALERSVASPAAGAIVTFSGTTRIENAGRRVVRLEYEAFESMALSEMHKLTIETGKRWKIVRIAMAHRVGQVDIGQTSVGITVSAAQWADAFEACRFAID